MSAKRTHSVFSAPAQVLDLARRSCARQHYILGRATLEEAQMYVAALGIDSTALEQEDTTSNVLHYIPGSWNR